MRVTGEMVMAALDAEQNYPPHHVGGIGPVINATAAMRAALEAALAVEGTEAVASQGPPSLDPMNGGCPHCKWIDTNLGRQLDEKCRLHSAIEELQVNAGINDRVIRDTNAMIHEVVSALGGGDDDSPVELAKARMEELAKFEELATTPPAGIREALERDAARWNALLRCARIEVRGSAGFDPKTGKRRNYDNASRAMVDGTKGWVHFSADFWSEYPGHEDADKKGRWGTVALTALADEVIRKDNEESSAALRGQS